MAVITVRQRTPQDWAEVAKRVEVYCRHVEQFGHVMWLPNVMRPKEGKREPSQEPEPLHERARSIVRSDIADHGPESGVAE